MILKNFLNPDYLFNYNTAVVSPGEKLFLFLGILFIILAAVFSIASKLAQSPVDRLLRRRFFRLFLTIGLSEVLWFLCRYQNAQFLGSHFMAWFIVLIGFVWLVLLTALGFKNYGKEQSAWQKEQAKLKYLPK